MYNVQMTCELSYGDDPRQYLDVCVPHGVQDAPLLICFHSGWFQFGYAEQLHNLMFYLAKAGIASASINYRLCSDKIGPQQIIADCGNAITTACEEAALLGADTKRPALLGSGVGGFIALHNALQNKERFSAVISCGTTPQLEPWDNASSGIHQALAAFKNHDTATLNLLKQDCSDLPPLLMMHGDSDPEVPATLARAFHARCIDAGTESTFSALSGTKHRFIEDQANRHNTKHYQRIVEWLQQRLFADHEDLHCVDPSFVR